MIFEPLPLKGAFLVTFPAPTDNRGLFVKTFHDTTFRSHGVGFELKESYFSISKKNVIRGMHFQTPPYHHSKVVFCPQGAILDVIVDLRKDSPTYGQHYAHELSQKNHKGYFIPEGFAHGFKALTDDAMTYYLVSSEHNKAHDTGIRFDSLGIDWGMGDHIVSERDMSFETFSSFNSPF